VLGFHVTDHGLGRGAALHLAADGGGEAAHLAADPDSELLRIGVAAIALVDVDAASLNAREPLQVVDHGSSVWPSKGLPCSAFAWSTNCPPLGAVTGVVRLTFASELVGRAGLAFADAFDLRRVERIDLAAALAVARQSWWRTLNGEIEEATEASLELGAALDLPVDVADDAAEPSAQELERAAGPA
jgi:hypothetical protein